LKFDSECRDVTRIITLVLLLPLLLAADSEPTTRSVLPARTVVTRKDVAEALLRVERVLAKLPPANADEIVRVNRAMDTAAYHFFSSNFDTSIRLMNELADSVEFGGDRARAPQGSEVIRSLKVRVAPYVALESHPSVFRLQLFRLYDVPIVKPIELRLVIRAVDEGGLPGKIVFEQLLVLQPDAALPAITTRQPEAKPGRYAVQIIGPDGHAYDVGRWYVVTRPLESIRQANERRLMQVEITSPKLGPALIATRARNELLQDRPAESDSAQFLVDPLALSREVDAEIEALQAGKDPFAKRAGEYWRTFPTSAMHVPARVYTPAQATGDEPLPVVIALHGAGADESMFMYGYGAGAIKRLADEHGFIVVAPGTYWMLPNPEAIEGILDALEFSYAIDRSRVYLVGHSLGALTAAGIAARHRDDVAAAVLIAGGSFAGMRRSSPALMIAAELDPIAPPADVRAAAESARAAGLPVEFELAQHRGHILIVGDVLPRAVHWLMQHRAPQKKPPPATQPQR
jgi:predicted esterase